MQKIVPAILTQDPADLRQKLELLRGHSKWVHIDIMDGTLVPLSTVNLFELREASKFFNLEVHLMVEDPFKYFEDCSDIGAKRVIFHAEAVENIPAFLEKSKRFEFQKSIALGPKLRQSKFESTGVLLMAIEPGAQGREFMPSVLQKIAEAKKLSPELLVGVDGGVKKENIKEVFQAGADYVVVGSEIMQSSDPVAAFKELEEMVK